jgi:small subunit ribosomal protein S1
LKLAEKSLPSSERIYSLGPLIHNPHVVNSLTEKGIEVIHDLRSVPGEQVLIRSHGAAPQVFQQAEEMNVRIIDATCPFVKRVQRQAAELVKNGYQVLILGQEDHPEVQGILG